MAEVLDKATCKTQKTKPISSDSSCQPNNHDPTENISSKLRNDSGPLDDLSKNKVTTTGHLHNMKNHYSTSNVTEDTTATPTADVQTTSEICEVDIDVLNNILVANVYRSSQAHGNTLGDSNTITPHDAANHISHNTQSLAEDDDYDEIIQYTTARDDEIIKLPGDPAYFPLGNPCTTNNDELIKLHEDPAYSSTIL